MACALAALALSGCGGGASAPTLVPEKGDGVRYFVPAGWHVARRSLTPHLINPRQLLTVGTGPLRPGGRCGQVPSAALEAMKQRDVLLAVQERYGSVRTFPPRPPRFSLPAHTGSEADECAGPRPAFVSHWFEFRDGGRGFHVLVAVGRRASTARVNEALAVLDSLRIAPRRPARIDANSAVPYDIPSRGLHLVLPAEWSVYRQTLTQAISSRDQLALGTFRLHQTTPDTNCTPATALRARGRDGGFIYAFELLGLSRRALREIPRRPARLRLPRSSFQSYECMGSSWMVRFRDQGRAFQAQIYGPPERRRQALAILDSLRIDRR